MPQLVSLDDAWPLAKYQGKQTDEVIIDDPLYVHWCWENERIDLTIEASELLAQALEAQRRDRR